MNRLKIIFLSILVVMLFLLILSNPANAQIDKARQPSPDSLKAFITATLDTIGNIPGLAMAVIDREGTLLEYVYGVRDIRTGEAITPETPFYIASSTKSFTALAAALLMREADLSLDISLAEVLPSVILRQPLNVHKITLRDLLSHQSRMENDAVIFRTAYSGEHTSALLKKLLGESTANSPGFDYTNLGYVTTGLIMEEKTGKDWKTVVREKVLQPLRLRHTYANVSDMDTTRIAQPHFAGGDSPQRIALLKNDQTMHAAGGHFSNIRDLARWVSVQLNGGKIDGEQVFPAAVILETQRKQAEVDRDFYRFHRHGYGLGWYLSDFAGEQLTHHFGSYSGYRAHVSFMKEHGVGVVVLLNDFSPATIFVPDLLAGYIYESLLNKDSLDARYRVAVDELRDRRRAFQARWNQSLADSPQPAKSLEAFYIGNFVSAAVGQMTIAEAGGILTASIGQLSSTMSATDAKNRLRVELIPLRGQFVEFFGAAQTADSLHYDGYTFVRRP